MISQRAALASPKESARDMSKPTAKRHVEPEHQKHRKKINIHFFLAIDYNNIL